MHKENAVAVAVLGNVDPAVFWSTENEYVDAYQRAGHRVGAYHEAEPADWEHLIELVSGPTPPDFVHWTRTKSFADKVGAEPQLRLLLAAKKKGVPVVGVHLDRWQGLSREAEVFTDPYFSGVDIFFSPDGDAEELWGRAGVNHRWLLPAISERWLGVGESTPKWECDVVFVGGWDNYGHKNWNHRADLIRHLSDWYGDRFLALPRRGQPRIVGRELNDVYASAKVVVGDSCLVPHADGTPKARYCSDRVPESLGRGAVLVHPHVEGVDEAFQRFLPWELGDWSGLRGLIDAVTGDAPDSAWAAGSKARELEGTVDFIAEHHTYTYRVGEIVATLKEEGLL